MFLGIDIGNTNVKIAVYNDDKLVLFERIPTMKYPDKSYYYRELSHILANHNLSADVITSSAVSCVVPEIRNTVIDAAKALTGIKPKQYVMNNTKMSILIDNPIELGEDLLFGCIGAAALLPLPCLVVDLGTASKISVTNKAGDFRGCAIAPGVLSSFRAMVSDASQIGGKRLVSPNHYIGTNTEDSILSGTILGHAAMIDELCGRLENELGEGECSLIASGGFSEEVIKNCRNNFHIREDLVTYGLMITYAE